MTSRQIELVQESFQLVQPIAREIGNLFYSRLFEIDPALRSLFRGDIADQGRKLMQMVAVCIAGLRRLDGILPVLEDLGGRHAAYGVTDKHYTIVAQALLWTLKQGLRDAFTDEVRDAWAAMYDLVTSAMKRGADIRLAAA